MSEPLLRLLFSHLHALSAPEPASQLAWPHSTEARPQGSTVHSGGKQQWLGPKAAPPKRLVYRGRAVQRIAAPEA
jgi:hypothetical protein